MIYRFLNEDSLQKIKNIECGFNNYPLYKAYSIRNYCYDFNAGVQALEVLKNSQSINLFLFYPGPNGEIDSIALYGASLQAHYNEMRKSMMVFGMPISKISMEYGMEEFVDIYLDY